MTGSFPCIYIDVVRESAIMAFGVIKKCKCNAFEGDFL